MSNRRLGCRVAASCDADNGKENGDRLITGRRRQSEKPVRQTRLQKRTGGGAGRPQAEPIQRGGAAAVPAAWFEITRDRRRCQTKMAIGCACKRAVSRTMGAGEWNPAHRPTARRAVSSQALNCSTIFCGASKYDAGVVGGLPHPERGLYSKHRPMQAGKGADDGTPDGLLQPLSVARRLCGGPDRLGFCATGDSKCAGRGPRAVDGDRGAAGPARARGAAGADLEGTGASAAMGPPAHRWRASSFVRWRKRKSQAVAWLFVVSVVPPTGIEPVSHA